MAWSITKRNTDMNPATLGPFKLVIYDYTDAVATTGTDVNIMDANEIIACWTGTDGVTVKKTTTRGQINILGSGTEDGACYVLYR